VLAALGSGGMSEVYRARDSRLQREVAIKVVGEALAGDAGILGRLEQEARLAGGLNHPNIVAVHDIGVHEGSPYVVTELLQGESLRERLSHGPVSVGQALDWAGQIAHALSAAHAAGVIHRDLKPENVFLTRTGQLKLLDFGIAKSNPLVTETRGLLDPTISPGGSATRTGSVLGTPGYMSPEQVRGEPLDPRSDIFSLGIVLHELLSGQRTFRSGSIVESGYSILHDDPQPLPPSVPPGVAQLVQRCLAKDPEQRFQSARDVAFALEALRGTGASTPAEPLPTLGRGRARAIRVIGWLVPVLLAVLGAYVAGRAARSTSPQPRVHQLTFHRGTVYAARFAADGKRVHFSAAWNDPVPELFTTGPDSRVFRALGVGKAELLSVSSHGDLAVLLDPSFPFAFGLKGTLAVVPELGGSPREIATEVFYADWTPDGKTLAVVRGGTEGTTLECPLGTVLFRSTGFVSDPRVSPSGDRIAFLDHPRPGDSGGRVMLVGKDGHTEIWSQDFDDAFGVAWSPDGEDVLVGAAMPGELAAIWSVHKGRPPRLVYRGTGNLLIDDVAPDGRMLARKRDWGQELVVVPEKGPPQSIEWLDWASVAGISNDGKKVLSFESGVGASPNVLAVLRNLDQPAPIQLGPGRGLALSGDGSNALVSRTDQRNDLLRLIPTGPGEPRDFTVPGLERAYTASFFKDGKRIALFGKTQGGPSRIFLHELGHDELRPISGELSPGYSIAVSPDERWVAAVESDGTPTLFPVDGGAPDVLKELGPKYQIVGWLQDGSLLAFERNVLPTSVVRFDLHTRAVTPFRSLTPPDAAGVPRLTKVMVTPDGKTFVFHFRRRTDVLYLLDPTAN
jgi:Tol biopolymer transport system component